MIKCIIKLLVGEALIKQYCFLVLDHGFHPNVELVLNIEYSGESNISEVLVFDMQGKAIQASFTQEGSIWKLNTSQMSSGTYLLKAVLPIGELSEKFVVQ